MKQSKINANVQMQRERIVRPLIKLIFIDNEYLYTLRKISTGQSSISRIGECINLWNKKCGNRTFCWDNPCKPMQGKRRSRCAHTALTVLRKHAFQRRSPDLFAILIAVIRGIGQKITAYHVIDNQNSCLVFSGLIFLTGEPFLYYTPRA